MGRPEERYHLTRKETDNRDIIHQINYPKQSYGFAGTQCGSSKPAVRGKRPTDSAPIIVSSQPPGVFALDDESWVQTYGASHDAWLGLLNGASLQISVDNSNDNFAGVFAATPRAANANLYSVAASQQQIHYVVSKETVAAGRAASTFGNISEVRSLGLRAPASIVGWGHTITMRPTDPNPSDVRANDDEHKLARETWKTGPLDIRWDERRGMWRAWNDLIADTYSNGLGTWVFATNNDATLGYPFLRGRLEDVWWVRKVNHNTATGRDNDDDKTGEICTTLAHKLFDPTNNGAAPLWDIFIIHAGDDNVIAGTETTSVSTITTPPTDNTAQGQGTLEIRTTAIYHFNNTLGGPIAFNSIGPVAPTDFLGPTNFGNLAVGEMLFGTDGRWHPTIVVPPPDLSFFDFCSNLEYSLHSTTHTENVISAINNGIFELQDFICSWNEEYTECILDHFEWTAKNAYNAVWQLNFETAPWLKRQLQPIVNSIMATIDLSVEVLRIDIERILQRLVTELRACTECTLTTPEINNVTYNKITIDVEQLGCPGVTPPECEINSFAEWQNIAPVSELIIPVENPCGPNDTLVGTCDSPGVQGGNGNLGGTEFLDPTLFAPPHGYTAG